MKNRKWISLAVSALLSVTALPTMAFAEAAATEAVKEATKKSAKELTEITLNEVAHSIFYAPQYVAIEEGYFAEEGIDLTLVTGFGADKVMTALLSGEAEIGFMGSEASIYTYSGGAGDAPVNFAQLTQRAGNFLVAREEMPDFTWADLIGKDVLEAVRVVCLKWFLNIFSDKMTLIHRRCRSIRALISALLPPHFPAERATSP